MFSNDLLFRLLGSLLDQHNLRGMHPRFAAVFICWVWLSLNINPGYKGNLFAKLSLAKEPWTPTDLPSLASSSYPIMSTALTIATMQEHPVPWSTLRESINRYFTDIGSSVAETSYLKQIEEQLNFCPMKYWGL